MPEVGLVQLARIALKVAQAMLPKHRSRFSKKQFTQTHLLALHSFMRKTYPRFWSKSSNPFLATKADAASRPLTLRDWLKWLVVDPNRHLLMAQAVHAGPVNDCAPLPALIEQARQHAPVHVVLANAEFDSERNQQAYPSADGCPIGHPGQP